MEKVFISHSSVDEVYAQIVIDILEKIGLSEDRIFCSSVSGYGTPFGENFLDEIRRLLNEDVVVVFILSKDYYNSSLAMCEMGAAWISAKKLLPIIIPPERIVKLKGILGNRINYTINDTDGLTLFRVEIEKLFDIDKKLKLLTWEKFKKKKLEEINKCIDFEIDTVVLEEQEVFRNQNHEMSGEIKHKESDNTISLELINIDLVKISNGSFIRLFDDMLIEVDNTFGISKYLVTQDLFEKITGDNPSWFKGDKLPVENISFREALEFCNLLSKYDNLEPIYKWGKNNNVEIIEKARGYRLPFEKEWDCALNYTKDYFVKGLSQISWMSQNSCNTTHEVGFLEANELGLFDMIGNVREWCFDNFLDIPNYSDSCGYYSNVTSRVRVLKGGSFTDIRSTLIKRHFRTKQHESRKDKNCGFRIVLQNL